jgi:NADH-quinone oxidoreductase subunit L
MVAMFFIVASIGSLDYAAMNEQAGSIAQSTATAISLLLFLACIGKSAQIGLHLWLPDAMEGPTPVSALIHAATMVTAGVFLACRAFPFFEASGDAMTVVAIFGAVTALFAGTIAIVQVDIKRVLAYSTVSQLGYMFLAVGVGAYSAAVFFVICHACYKATLFLGAGTVIHGTENEQDVRDLGGLRRFMPITALSFVVAWLAISGVPPFSGFWAKDDVLASAFFDDSYVTYAIALIAVVFTGVYMTREVLLVFFGNQRFRAAEATATVAEGPAAMGDGDDPGLQAGPGATGMMEVVAAHEGVPTASPTVDYDTPPAPPHLTHDPHEGARVMVFSVVVLAILSIFIGFIELPFTQLEFLTEWLDPVFEGVSEPHPTSFLAGLGLSLLAIVVAATGILYAWRLYQRGLERRDQDPLDQRLGAVGRFLGHAWYYDEGIAALVGGPLRRAATWLADVFDARIIDGAVNGVAWLFREAAGGLRRVQTGLVRQYALGVAVGVVVLLLWALARAGLA